MQEKSKVVVFFLPFVICLLCLFSFFKISNIAFDFPSLLLIKVTNFHRSAKMAVDGDYRSKKTNVYFKYIFFSCGYLVDLLYVFCAFS